MFEEALRILLVEDNPQDAFLLRRDLHKVNEQIIVHHCELLSKALEFLLNEDANLDVVLLDLGLPDSQGLSTFAQVRRQTPRIPIVVLSGMEDEKLAIRAVREGAQDYLVKGEANAQLLVRALFYAVERMKSEEALVRARDELETKVKERTSELALANEALKRVIAKLSKAEREVRSSLQGIIHVISMIIETRDPYTAGHQRNVAEISRAIAQRMDLPEERIEGIVLAATVHDLGKISIPAETLSKPTKLNDFEMSLIRFHPQSGYEILKMVDFPWPIAEMVRQHHERIDGSGYPQGLSGEDILLEARIIGVADVVDAMCSHRPYRPALGIDKALVELLRNNGTLYDPPVVEACMNYFEDRKSNATLSDKFFPEIMNSTLPSPSATT
ncbi:MAG: HD domain-containing protein [Deltaproteobacteria bacterium]|nr:MAG: HD domain-containing protein [Deltaproteobacteria bacterium]